MTIGSIRKYMISREPVIVRVLDGAHFEYIRCDYIYGIHFHGHLKGFTKTKVVIDVECAQSLMASGEPKSLIVVDPEDVFPVPVEKPL